MDTKLKNYRNLKVFIIGLVILLPSLAMMILRPHYIQQEQQGSEDFNYSYESISSYLVEAIYVLHGEEMQNESNTALTPYDIFFSSGKTAQTEKKEEETPEDEYDDEAYDSEGNAADAIFNQYGEWCDDFSNLRSYLEYEVLDENENIIDSNRAKGNSAPLYDALGWSTLNGSKDYGHYAFIAVVEYGANGNIVSTSFLSHETTNASQILNETAKENPTESYKYDFNLNKTFQNPQNKTYCFAMTKDSLKSFSNMYPGMFEEEYQHYSGSGGSDLLIVFLSLLAAVALAAFFLPYAKVLETGNEKIFRVPFEIVAVIGCSVFGMSVSIAADLNTFTRQAIYSVLTSFNIPHNIALGMQYIWGLIGWLAVFALCYWTVSCLRAIFTMGPMQYLRERVILYRIWPWLCRTARRVYDSLLHADLTGNTNRVLLKIVLINFIILGFISMMWFWGIGALVVYSVVLFYLLQKYLKKIQEQYKLLLEATNELAKGNLNGTIPEDLGVFEPFRDEIDKIQTGFKKAVDEEVKSTRMKTDLITNVSHDLKTPLTAIITYVDLLKKEDLTEEERSKYIGILDQKANRLKILIEDLFEVSKATSKAITLNIVDVDIVSLLRQVKLELQDKIDATDLIFRWQLPEEKIVLPLDSQRTYRVFENLIVNITKYAMPHSRAYITMENTENHVKITMKNISATELDFNPSEITERFVRGDASRNTEGSGLGLAIAKSFTELQGGRLEISTDADLFTVEITFLK